MTMPENVAIEEKVVNREDYVEAQPNSTRCVDERKDKEGKNLGIQMPGGSEHLMDLMLVAIKKAGGEVDDEVLCGMVGKVYESEVARANNLTAGVHIDDEHGHLDTEACANRDGGCGYDKVRGEVIENVFGIEVASEPGSRIRKARELGWGVQVLTGDHRNPGNNESVTAALNFMKGKTLDTATLWEEGRTPSFNHDIWVVETLQAEMQQQLEAAGFSDAAKLLEENAVVWSREIYGETLNILSGGELTGENLI
jgi:hypothetical protein